MTAIDFGYSDTELAGYEQFEPSEPLEFLIEEVRRAPDGSAFTLVCQILTGKKRGAVTLLNFASRHRSGKRNRTTLAFLKAMFSTIKGVLELDRLLGRKFSCVSRLETMSDGKPYQDFMAFKDLGSVSTEVF